MSDYLSQLASAEAVFRTGVIDGLQREAQRLRDHQVLLSELPAVGQCLGQLATTLQDAADKLRSQDGLLDDAIEVDEIYALSDRVGSRRPLTWPCAS